MSDGWVPGGFSAITPTGLTTVAGWIKGSFALDFRPFHWDLWSSIPDDAMPALWVVTHIPSSYSVMSIADTFDRAKVIVAELDALTDWSVVTFDNSRWFHRRVCEVAERYRGLIYHGSQTITPWIERA
ncbi:hypothetical protein [uncultured Sphingomonas sp.]|uniref:hypothetical protein n=1 Tax=uncultured Sphingomonas sp. TaxID=158754 RepID=UPI0025DD8DD4|nr:hypothetical protein [uncultured Sphingomonas sp.]